MSGKAQQQSRIKELITRGREQGYLTYAEVNDHLPEDISDPEQVEDIIRMINDMGINVFESAPDADALLLAEADTDEAAAEEAAAAPCFSVDILLSSTAYTAPPDTADNIIAADKNMPADFFKIFFLIIFISLSYIKVSFEFLMSYPYYNHQI